jgi:hypothetical protein
MPAPTQLREAPRPKRYSPRQVLEELPSLDCRWLARKKLFPRDHSNRRYNFEFINPAIRWLTLAPRAAEIVLPTGQAQLIPINWLPIYGVCKAMRPSFECPGCGHNAFKIYYRDGYFAGCYRCINVPYASQQRSRKGRARLQAARLRLFLNSSPDDRKIPARQPYTSRRVYTRFLARLHKLERRKSSRRQRPLSRKLSHKVLRPLTAYDSERYALD